MRCPRQLFEHLGLDQGLPHAVGMTMAQDGDGYIWIGTQSGLARWDGYRVRSFHHDAAQPTSLPGDFVQVLHVDVSPAACGLALAAAGLAMYDKRSESFIHPVDDLSHGPISALASDSKGNLWIGTTDGLKYYDTVHRTIHRYSHEEMPGLPDNQIRSLLMDRAGTSVDRQRHRPVAHEARQRHHARSPSAASRPAPGATPYCRWAKTSAGKSPSAR